MSTIQTSRVQPGSPELAICARWRVEAFADVLGASFDDDKDRLEQLAADQFAQAMLIATRGGVPAGTCLLVSSEIEPVHSVTPWLAGLFVTPARRRLGVGEALVRAIEAEAKQRGHPRLYLYTDDAVGFYERLGWTVIDRVTWHGFATALMERELRE